MIKIEPFLPGVDYFLMNLSADIFILSSVVFLLLLIAYAYKIINLLELILFLFSISIVFISPLIFPPTYREDQIPYTNMIRELRNGIEINDTSDMVFYSTHIYNLLPLPTPSSVTSFGMFNKIILITTLLILKKFKYIDSKTLFILLIFPSLAIYSSIALREMLVLLIMIIWLVLILNNKYVFAIIIASIFIFVKKQNFIFFVLYTFMHFYYFNYFLKIEKKIIKFSFITLSVLILLILYKDLILYYVNSAIITMHNDNFQNSNNYDMSYKEFFATIPNIDNYLTLFVELVKGFYFSFFGNINFLSQNKFVILQSLENIFLIFVLFYISLNQFNEKNKDLFFWLFYLFLSLAIVGMVIDNFGTLSRFKYSFIVLFIIAVNNLKKNNIFKS
jgi:hypothetical protein